MTTPDSTQDTPEATATAEAPAATSAPTPAPRPGPRPGPKPGPKPGPHPSAPVLTTLASDPRRHGRVDADGTVWLITADGERVIATWQAGDADAAYEHFGRRYDDLATEVALLERRLASGAGDARKIGAAAAHLIETLPEAHVLGDVDALRARLAVLAEHAGEAAEAARAEREQRRAEQTARKEALAAEAEDLAANSTQWKSAGERFKTILDEWKAISGLDRKTDDLLWKRFSAARESFNRRRGTHFAELDRGRAGVRKAKTELCERAEALAASTDWAATSSAFRNLLTEWKAAGRTTRDIDDALWKRFKAAQDTFFTARNAQSAEREAELTANAEAKEQLLAEAEKIDVSNRKAARAALRAITDKWDELGRAPRERAAELERRLRVVEKKIRDAEESDRPDPEAQARAEQFIARAEQFEKQAAKAEAAGRAKEAEQARASAAQWRDWAQTATQAVSKKR